MKKVGVLALQGAFVEHIAAFGRLGVEARPVRLPGELEGLEGLVIPGGESTTIGKLMMEYGLLQGIKGFIEKGLPVMGTCAGMILLAKRVIGLNEYSLRAMDIEVRRNAFGRQVDSFETELSIPVLGEAPFPAVFIRAPWIERVGPQVEVLAKLGEGTPIVAKEGKLLALAFHPELTEDLRFHAYFLSLGDAGKLGK